MKFYIQHPTLPLFVSSDGDVKKLNFKTKHTYVNAQGYLELRFKKKKPNSDKFSVKCYKIHRLVAELFLEAPSEELVGLCSKTHHRKVCVKHLDNNKLNNCANNLMFSTSESNTSDAWRDGLIKGLKGSANGRAKITEELVHEMCKCFEQGMMPKEAEVIFKVSSQQASKIRAGHQWKHIWCQYNIKVNRRTKTSNDQSESS